MDNDQAKPFLAFLKSWSYGCGLDNPIIAFWVLKGLDIPVMNYKEFIKQDMWNPLCIYAVYHNQNSHGHHLIQLSKC